MGLLFLFIAMPIPMLALSSLFVGASVVAKVSEVSKPKKKAKAKRVLAKKIEPKDEYF